MKTTIHFLAAITISTFIYFMSACATDSAAKIALTDASIPKSELSLIVALNANGDWTETMLVSIDDSLLNVPGSLFYIPSGIRTLKFKTTTSSYEDTDYKFKRDRTEYVRTTYSDTSNLQITDTFLPGHTYRIVIRNASNVIMEDITGSVKWLPPKVSPFSPNDGVLTNWAHPRGAYVMPYFNAGMFAQYTHELNGYDAQGLGRILQENKVTYDVKGQSGLHPVMTGMFFQFGPEFGFNKIGLSTVAEVNGSIGFGGDTYGMGSEFIGFLWGYSFTAELFYYEKFGVGFGYGGAGIFPHPTAFDNLDAYDNHFPFYRGEILFLPKSSVPITIYSDYFFKQETWALGIKLNFVPKGEKIPGKRI